ncbi:hypothetical protein [Winogradskyella thalassocola]|uniref:PD-(D/E)XK nuclease superfamily protein n=1 Tax=Winogradskyella thalassocola TaxID=262004 RepID=A0A1G8B9I1_9FLAO|nr:hypothetical protein [Winogradskyella thalassocola]SDH29845.1 hypothetical protein SAMN04489796_102198 [Winogradskyella thalassocola]
MNETIIERFTFFVIIGILLYIALKLKIAQYNKKRKQKKRFARGLMLENKARGFLQDKGYSIVGEQEQYFHRYKVNNKNFESKIILDYVVEKDGKKFIVEVKSGKSAISVQDKNSRRQLLEYDFVIENDGIFLLDMENRTMKLVKFYTKAEHQRFYFYKFLLVLATIGILIPFWNIKILLMILIVLIWKYPEKTESVLNMISI